MDEYVYTDEPIDTTELLEKNKNLDLTKQEDLEIYIDNLVTIELEELKEKYSSNNQIYLINNYLYEIIYEEIENEYKIKSEEKKIKLEEEKSIYLEKIKEDNYKYFVSENITKLQASREAAHDRLIKERIEELIRLSEYRLKNEIPFDNKNYLNNAIEEMETDLVEYDNLNHKENLTKSENERLKVLKEAYLKNNYILDNKIDANNHTSLQAVLRNFNDEFSIFFIIYIVMICGSIVSEEFNKGTIKYLLTKPYKRRTILTAKLITALLLIPVVILFMILSEILIGGIILGYSSLNTPVLIYNAVTDTLVNYNILKYLFLMLATSLPAYLILGIVCFSLSTITTSTSAAITITFLFYLASEVISNLALMYKIKIFNGFISLHWNFNYLVNLKENPYHMTTCTSIFIIFAYISVILCLTYLYFNKKDVKNI